MLAQLYLYPEGRCSRRFYWLFGILPFFVLGIVLGLVARSFGLRYMGVLVISLLLLWPAFAMQIKRWHDIDRSGWFALLALIPYLGALVWIVTGLIPGTVGENRYGPDPLRGKGTASGAP